MEKEILILPIDDIEMWKNPVIELYGPDDSYLGYTHSEIVFLEWRYRIIKEKKTGYYYINTRTGERIDINLDGSLNDKFAFNLYNKILSETEMLLEPVEN